VGCGTCVGVCPQTNLEINETKMGHYLPSEQKNNCISCGICYATCPARFMPFKFETEFGLHEKCLNSSPLIGEIQDTYLSKATEQQRAAKGSSGGIISSILVYALENNIIDGAITVGMSKSSPWKPIVEIAQTKEEILKNAGSKYSIVPINSIFRSIQKTRLRYALVGLPCQIHGLQIAQQYGLNKISDRIVLTIGPFCGLNLKTTAINFLLQKIGVSELSTIRELEYRHGYPGRLYVKLAKSELFLPKRDYEFVNLLFRNEGCSFCNDLTNELADISVGDIFCLHSKDPVGIALARNKIGQHILSDASTAGYLRLNRINRDEVTKSQYTGLLYKKRGAPVREYIRMLGLSKETSIHDTSIQKNPPTGKQLIFEIIQQKILFGKINRILVAVSKNLPLRFVSFFYRKILVILFLIGKYCYTGL
jgi:coenzyme F420 hydrogenase subunit beta